MFGERDHSEIDTESIGNVFCNKLHLYSFDATGER